MTSRTVPDRTAPVHTVTDLTAPVCSEPTCAEPAPRFDLRSLDRRDALLALDVRRFVMEDLDVDWRGSALLVALSGGIDSTALLVLLTALRDPLGLSLTAAHLDHGLRPESADDAAACSALCRRLSVPFLSERVDVAGLAAHDGIGLEEAGRNARYAFLETARRQVGADWILTAHHAGDLAEDILLRLIRGAGWPGLGGMKGVDHERRLLRPLLMVEKERLLSLLERQGLPWQEDASNSGRDFRRNRVRHDILPLLQQENPAFLDAAKNLWRSARLDEAYWDGMTKDASVSVVEGILIPDACLQKLPKAGRLRAYVAGLRRLGVGQTCSATLFALDDAWEQRRRGKVFRFTGAVGATVRCEGIFFSAQT